MLVMKTTKTKLTTGAKTTTGGIIKHKTKKHR